MRHAIHALPENSWDILKIMEKLLLVFSRWQNQSKRFYLSSNKTRENERSPRVSDEGDVPSNSLAFRRVVSEEGLGLAHSNARLRGNIRPGFERGNSIRSSSRDRPIILRRSLRADFRRVGAIYQSRRSGASRNRKPSIIGLS